MKDIYRTIFSQGIDEIIINKSRFIGYSSPINNEEEALEFIESIESKHRDATHNVYAYVFGENSKIQRFSDDGEPSGTAGVPALEVIKKEDLRNVVVVITRYFGGTKLGGGGLIRAYTRGAKVALEAGEIVDMVLHKKLELKMDYTLYGKIENYLMANNYIIEDTKFEDNVSIIIHVKTSKLDKFVKTMMNLTSGTVEIIYFEDVHLPILKGKRLI